MEKCNIEVIRKKILSLPKEEVLTTKTFKGYPLAQVRQILIYLFKQGELKRVAHGKYKVANIKTEDTENIAKSVRENVEKLPLGSLFIYTDVAKEENLITAAKELSRMIQRGDIQRIKTGIYYKPFHDKEKDEEATSLIHVFNAAMRRNNESVQPHGEAALIKLGLSSGLPFEHIYVTNKQSRILKFKDGIIELIHSADPRKVQFGNTPVGLAASALWYLGEEGLTNEKIRIIKDKISFSDFEKLKKGDLPIWLMQKLQHF